MATAARLALSAWRYEACVRTIRVVGLDLTDVDFGMQVRMKPDTPGAALIDLAKVPTEGAEGLHLDSVETIDEVPTSTIALVISAETMGDKDKVPYTGELGQHSVLAYALQIAGQVRLWGDFIALASTYGSDNAPVQRTVGVSLSPNVAAPWATTSLTIAANEVIEVTIDGAAALGAIAARAEAAADRAEDFVLSFPDIHDEPDGSEWAFRLGTDGGPTVGWKRSGEIIGSFPAIDQIPDIAEEPDGSEWALRLGTSQGPNVGFKRTGAIVGSIPPATSGLQSVATATQTKPVYPIPSVVVLGDSTAAGAGASSSATAWRSLVGDALGIGLVNLGIGGQNAEQIAARYGAVETALSVAGASIPASGSAAVTAIAPEILFNGSSDFTRTIDGTIDGHAVRITHNLTDGYTIEQLGGSGAIGVTDGSVFVPDNATDYRDAALIVCAGTNDRSSDIYAAIENIRRIVDFNRPYFKRVLVATPRCHQDDAGSSAYEAVITIGRLLKAIFGEDCVDMRSFLINDALGVLGMTPTAQDLTDISNDVTPTSLTADGLHSNDDGHRAEAWLFERILTARSIV